MRTLSASSVSFSRVLQARHDPGRRQEAVTNARLKHSNCHSSTGEAALEVGLTDVLVNTVWNDEANTGGARHAAVHMLPVFRLPHVTNSPAGGFIRRLPRAETERERDDRLREAEELEKMKRTLGLTDRELGMLEGELLQSKRRQGQDRAGSTHERDHDDDLKREPSEVLYGAGRIRLKEETITNGGGKRQRVRAAGENVRGRDKRGEGEQGSKYEIFQGGRRAGCRPRDVHRPPFTSGDVACLDRPTPRVLQRTSRSTFGAELATSAALSVRRTGQSRREGAWTSTGNSSLGVKVGSILGTTVVTTEQLITAAADVGMVNLLELRKELGRSVGQVGCTELDTTRTTRACPLQGYVRCNNDCFFCAALET